VIHGLILEFHYCLFIYKYKSLLIVFLFNLKESQTSIGRLLCLNCAKNRSTHSPQINRRGSISNEHDSYYNNNVFACGINTHYQLMSRITTGGGAFRSLFSTWKTVTNGEGFKNIGHCRNAFEWIVYLS
jgi:hypothetical protein